MAVLTRLTLAWLFTSVAASAQTPSSAAQPAQVLVLGQALQRQLSPGASHIYSISLIGGHRYRVFTKPRAIQVWSRAYAPDNTWLGQSWSRDDSAGVIDIIAETAGLYRLEIQWVRGDSTRGSYNIDVQQQSAEEAAVAGRELDDATKWLRASAHPLRGVTAGSGFADLMPLKKILSGVRIVGLGEATHGSREFHQVKHRIFEFLVREMGFTVFALETSQTAAHAINDFVLSGKGDRARVLAGQGFFNWDTEEMATMLDWMRDYNRNVAADRQVRFAGFDFQYNPGARLQIRSYLTRVAPERVASADSMLVILSESADSVRPDFIRYYSLSDDAKVPLVARINELLGFLVVNRRQLVKNTSLAQYDSTVQSVRLLAQLAETHVRPGFEQHIAESGVSTRDRFMAENIAGLLAAMAPGTKMVLSAQNEHIRRDAYIMGYYLGEEFGSAYYAFGLAFGQGGFQALSLTGKGPNRLTAFTVGPAFQGTADWFLSRLRRGDHFVDFRGAPKVGAAGAWFGRAHQMRSIGNGFFPGTSGYGRVPVTLGKSFDGMIFIERTTRARKNATVLR